MTDTRYYLLINGGHIDDEHYHSYGRAYEAWVAFKNANGLEEIREACIRVTENGFFRRDWKLVLLPGAGRQNVN